MITSNELPHSIEAEELLLSSCLIDGRAVVARCQEAQISRSSFYDSKHGAIFAVILQLIERGSESIDVGILAEELKVSGQLEMIGGYAFLTQVTNRIPTTAQADYYIRRVRGLQSQRELIRAARRAADSAVGCDPEQFEQITGELRFAVETITTSANSLSSQLKARRMDPATTPPKSRVVYSLGKVPVCTAQNLTTVNAEAKAGKSAFIGAMLAAPMAAPGADCLSVSGSNEKGHAVLHFDTEQSASDWFSHLCQAKRRAGIVEFPPWLVSYTIAGMSAAECRSALEIAMAWAQRDFGGIHSVLIDGIADLIVDPNDAEETFPFVTRLHALAIKYDCPIVSVLHRNPGSEKTRGHLGSQLERKSESNLTMEKDAESGTTVVFSLKQRGAPIPKADGPTFRWSDGEGMHVTGESVRARQDHAKAEQLRQVAVEVFSDNRTLTYSKLRDGVQATAKCSERTADKKVSEMNRLGVIVRFPPNLYTLAA